MKQSELHQLLAELARGYGVPGAAAGLWHAGQATFACYGVTSLENPLPIDEHSLFQAGSITKTFTAAALLRLTESGRVALDEPVLRTVPELRLADATAATQVTLLHLLNHSAGWEGDFFADTGEGDDALARYVSRLGELVQLERPGVACSYNNAAFCLAGRVIENVCGEPFEQAIGRLILQPLGMRESFFFRDEVMTRRFAVGHKPSADGLRVARPWAMPRNGAPAGALVTSIADLLAWARFQLGDGRGADGVQVLGGPTLRAMREPTLQMPGSSIGDAVGLGWRLTDIGGIRLVGHDGSTNGQESSLCFLPANDWALALLTNASPGGLALNAAVRRRVLAACTGIVQADPRPVSAEPAALAEYAGEYRARGMHCQVGLGESGDLTLTLHQDAELLALMCEPGEAPAAEPERLHAGLVDGSADRVVLTDGPVPGMTGFFVRDEAARVQALHLFGRCLPRRGR